MTNYNRHRSRSSSSNDIDRLNPTDAPDPDNGEPTPDFATKAKKIGEYLIDNPSVIVLSLISLLGLIGIIYFHDIGSMCVAAVVFVLPLIWFWITHRENVTREKVLDEAWEKQGKTRRHDK